jgi:CRP-like cAMP-binding protein
MLKKLKLSALTKKAESGDLKAQIELAAIHENGSMGMPTNRFLAYKYYSLAARHNHPEALFFIAACQDYGIMMPHNISQAFQNYIKAADQNHPAAAFAAGYFYETARATQRDIKLARHYYKIAAANGHKFANGRIEALDNGNFQSKESPNYVDLDFQKKIEGLKLEERSIFELAIQSIPFLKGISESHLLYLTGNLMTKSLEKDEVLFNQGDESNGLFILLSGELSARVKVSQDKSVDILTVNPTDYIGEFGLIDGQPRSATIHATIASELAFFSQKSFDILIKDQEDLIRLIVSNLCDMIINQHESIEGHELKRNILNKTVHPGTEEIRELVNIIRENNSRHALRLLAKQEKNS